MSIRNFRAFLFAALAAASVQSIPARDAAVSVEESVRNRTGFAVRWQQDAEAREECLRTVHSLLGKPLTMRSAVQIALLNNRDLLMTFEDIGVSAADLREAGLWKNPSIDLSVRFPDRPSRGPDWEESAAFDLLDLLMIPLRKRVAADHLEAARLRVADAVLKLVADAKRAFFMLQASEELVSKMNVARETEQVALELAQKQHEAGNITDLDLLRQQARYDEARLDLASVESDRRGQREALNRLLGLWGQDTEWKVTASLPQLPSSDPSISGLESLAVVQRFDLAAAHVELSSQVRALGLTKSYRYIGALQFGADTEREKEGDHLTGPKLTLELPIFNQGQARIARGEAELRRAERKVENIAIEIRSEVRELADQLAAKRETVRFYQDEILPGRAAILQQSLLRYNGMLLGNYELFAARTEEAAAERKAVEALRDYWTTRADLERAVGGSLSAKKTPPSERKTQISKRKP